MKSEVTEKGKLKDDKRKSEGTNADLTNFLFLQIPLQFLNQLTQPMPA